MSRPDKAVGMRLHSGGDPQIHRRRFAHGARHIGEPPQLYGVIYHDPPHPGFERHAQLSVGLIISVEIQTVGRKPGLQRGVELAARHHISSAALFVYDAVQFLEAARLAGVRHPSAVCGVGVHRGLKLPQSPPDGRLVHDIKRCTKGLRQRNRVAAPDSQMPLSIDIQAVRYKHACHPFFETSGFPCPVHGR